MLQSKLKDLKFERWASGLALAFSLAALLFSWQANNIAREANELTLDSIEVARDSNRISLLDKADPQANQGDGTIPIFVYGCKYPSSDLYYVYSLAHVYITFSNNGGRIALLERVELRGTQYPWTINVFEEQPVELEFPISILPNTSRRWHLISKRIDSSFTESEMNQAFWDRRTSSPVLTWVFYFNDGRVITWEAQAYGSAQALDFSRNCEDLDKPT